MGLFDSLPPPGPRCIGPSPPPWLFPPDNVLGSFVPQRVVFVRSQSLLVVAQRFVAYPAGVDFSVEIRVNDRLPRAFAIPDRLRAGPPTPHDNLAVGIVDAVGGRASSLSRPSLEDEPLPPVVSTYRGRGGSGTGWTQRCWMWPLPPPGPLQIVVAWPRAGLAETWGELDGATLRAAGLGAPVLWDY